MLAASPAAPASTGEAAATRPRAAKDGRIDAIVLDAALPDVIDIAQALRARVGSRAVGSSDRARRPRPDELFAYVEVMAQGPAATIRVLLSDGRAYYRALDGGEGSRAREIATIVGNLVAGIDEDSVAADEERVPVPTRLQAAAAKPREAPPPQLPPPRPPRWTITGAGLVIAGVARPEPTGFAGAGGRIGFAHRSMRGVTLGASLRVAAGGRRGHALTRIRVAAEIGHLLQHRRFELATTFAVTAEPWVVTRAGAVANGARRPASALLGAALRIAPGVVIAARRGGAIRLAPFVEVAGSAIPSSRGGIARVREDAGMGARDLFRVGGLELSAGVELGLWLR